jgi:hypothetical protein
MSFEKVRLIHVNNRAQLLALKARTWASTLQAMRASLLISAIARVAAGSPLTNSTSQRVKCPLDTLLSGAFKTVAEARDKTQRRHSEIEEI